MRVSLALYCLLWTRIAVIAAQPHSPAEEVSGDPEVLQLEMYPPRDEATEMGPNLILGMIEGKLGLVAQLKSSVSKKTDFSFERDGITTKISVALRGDAPPYTIVFEQSISPVQPPRIAERRQEVEFPIGKVTRARLFEVVDIKGFYGNPQKKRP